MSVYTHGGDILSAAQSCGGAVLDFSANLNPLGMPEAVEKAARDAIAGAIHYPDPFCRELTGAIARRDGVTPEQILCGNGAADLIFRFAFSQRAKKALVTAPTFSEYEQAMTAAGTEVLHHFLRPEEGFAVTPRILEDLKPGLDVVFLCNPNNPTGRKIQPDLLLEILERCRALGIRPVLDECFLDLTDGGRENSMVPRLGDFPSLLILRAFTKCYAIPGLRLGYCITADRALLEALSFAAQPWSVSAPAQAAGVAALALPEHPEKARALIREQRQVLETALKALGYVVFSSAANYILFQAPGVGDLKERLVQKGILIRSCANYPGLGPDYYRIAVRTPEENEVLLRTLKEIN
jgi:threonine-phosphate decarboxylase